MDIERWKAALAEREPTLMDASGRYAVLVPLVEHEGKWNLLYEVRASSLKRQPGEVCFPGGRIEKGESPIDCALRETWEELGIPKEEIEVLGSLDFIAHRANFILYPILAKVSQRGFAQMRPSKTEVDTTFLVPLEYLQKTQPLEYEYQLIPHTDENFPYELLRIPRDYQWQIGGENVAVYPWKDYAIWGLTGRITRHVVLRIPK